MSFRAPVIGSREPDMSAPLEPRQAASSAQLEYIIRKVAQLPEKLPPKSAYLGSIKSSEKPTARKCPRPSRLAGEPTQIKKETPKDEYIENTNLPYRIFPFCSGASAGSGSEG